VYYYLLSSTKRRLILELQDSFSRHPIYSKLVDYIQTKYSFKERPHFGIVLKGSSVNKVALSSDNFLGRVHSHVMLAYLGEPVYPLEWVREDLAKIRQTGYMPTAPGVYYMEILSAPTNPTEPGTFVIDPLLTVPDEAVIQFTSGIEQHATLQNVPSPGTLRLWLNRRILLQEGADYTVDSSNIQFIRHYSENDQITAEYRYPVDSIGPVDFYWNQANFSTLPGVVLAFGKRAKVGDKVAIVVYQDRVDTALAYGGKFEFSFDLDVIATDPAQMEEITDLVIMYLWGEKKSRLEFEGLEITDISMGGESEEAYDEQADLYFYTAAISLAMRGDWEIHIPLPLTISRATTEQPDGSNGLRLEVGRLFYATSPIVVGRNNDYERIG
jgi:hypothetical protein